MRPLANRQVRFLVTDNPPVGRQKYPPAHSFVGPLEFPAVAGIILRLHSR